MKIERYQRIQHRLVQGAMALILAVGPTLAATASTLPGEGLPGDWLSRYASPFAAGMGGATVAVGREPQAALWNPATLAAVRSNIVQATGAVLFDNTSVTGLSFVTPANKLPTFGLNILSLTSGSFERTNDLNESLGTFSEGHLVMALSVAEEPVPGWSVGGSVKLARQTLEDFSGGGVGVDLGVLGTVAPGIKLGASALNLGGPTITLRDRAEPYAREYRGGVSAALLGGNGLFSAEVVHRDGPGNQLHLGGQYRLNSLALRAGYGLDNIAAGFSYDFESGLKLDYGVNDHPLGIVHRFGVSYAFGGFYATNQASPATFSPMGYNPVTKFLLTAHTKSGVVDWQLQIRDRSGELVRSYSGRGQPPAQVIWDGKGQAGLPLPDGHYTYVLSVVERDGSKTTARARTVEITTGGPQGSIGVQ